MKKTSTEADKATFIVEVHHRQNSSWQGTVKWVEKQETCFFRSALELVKIIDSAHNEGYQINFDYEDERVSL